MKDTALLLKAVFDFLGQLSDKQLDDLVNKRAKLNLEYNEKPQKIFKEFYLDSVCNLLEQKNTRVDALQYFSEQNFNKQELQQLVKHYKIPLANKATNSQMIDAIIEAVIGSKLRYDALYNTNLNK